MRGAGKATLFEVGPNLKVLRMEINWANVQHLGVIVDEEGDVVEGGLREAVKRGLVTREVRLAASVKQRAA